MAPLMMTLGFALEKKHQMVGGVGGAAAASPRRLFPAHFEFKYPVRIGSRVTTIESEGDGRRYFSCVRKPNWAICIWKLISAARAKGRIQISSFIV